MSGCGDERIWGCENEDYWIGNRKWGMGKADEQLNSRTSEPCSNLEREALNLEREALNLEREALNLEREALNLEREALNLEREALNLKREAIEQSKHLQHNPPKSPTN